MLTIETIDTTTEEGQYLVAAVMLLFKDRAYKYRHFNDALSEIRKELDFIKTKYPEKFPKKVVADIKRKCIRCGVEIESNAILQLCGDCQWEEYSGFEGRAM